MEFLITIIIISVILGYILQKYFSSHQLWIRPFGFEKMPKLLLELAGIEKTKDASWQSLNNSDKKKVVKYYEKLRDVASIQLTFLYLQNLVHIQVENSYFFPLDKSQNFLVQKEIGKIGKNIVEFVLYRKHVGFLKSPILVGYLKKEREFALGDDENKDIEILFEFPEALIAKAFFTKHFENKFKLKKDSDILGGYKNDLGEEEPHGTFTAYDQEYSSGCHFNFVTW